MINSSPDEINHIKGEKMSVLPEKVSKAWNDRKGPVVLTTVDKMEFQMLFMLPV